MSFAARFYLVSAGLAGDRTVARGDAARSTVTGGADETRVLKQRRQPLGSFGLYKPVQHDRDDIHSGI